MDRPLPHEPLANESADDVRKLARLLDAAVRIPGTNIRIGLDALLGFVPGVGDAIGAALSGYIVLAAARLGLPKSVIARMLVNLGVDTVVGAVPVVGDLFDVAFRANTRNVALIEAAMNEPRRTRVQSRKLVAGVVAAILGVLALAVVAIVLLFRAIAAIV
ncbi:MAG TPA: DUF4112 domain-containing protein [Candidatus Saccharimonadia bacterium]|nr:DUF4112 domain-containing protein [Candidatus Saccharimonadia bacterium]